MATVSLHGMIVAEDGINGIALIESCADTIADVCKMWMERDRGGLSKQEALRIMRGRAEFILARIAENESVPTVAEYEAAQN